MTNSGFIKPKFNMRSLSEIETVSKRASRATGFSWGISEEIGKNIRLLESCGLPGIKNLNSFLKDTQKQKFENLKSLKENNVSDKNCFCPISFGTSFLDQSHSFKEKKLTINKLAYPILLIPFLSRSSEIIGKRIQIKFDNIYVNLNYNLNMYSNNNFEQTFKETKDVKINLLDNVDSFTDTDWKELYQLSEDTFVEESESLKQGGAGAGLTDND